MTRLNFGEKELQIEIPMSNMAFEIEPRFVKGVPDEVAVIREAIKNPIGCKQLSTLVNSKMKITILCDDNTRPTPAHKIIPIILEELRQAGLPDSQIKIVIASGSHRSMSEEELEEKLGSAVLKRLKISQHHYKDHDNLVDFGTTRRGTRVWLNKEVAESDFKIAVGNLVPHWPTGWSGGAKILLPGVAGNETVYMMHLLGVNEQQLGKTVTPCREEMEDFAKNVGLDFIVNTILNDDGEILSIVAGDFIAAHREGVSRGRKVYGVNFPKKADLTLSSTFPIDYDLFQADKGLFSAALATKPGGEIILISPCYEGISPTHQSMVELGGMTEEAIWQLVYNNSFSDLLAAAEMLGILSLKKQFQLTLVSEGISKEVAKSIGLNFVTVSELPQYISKRLQNSPALQIGVLRNSGKLLPLEPRTAV